jgi:hypothetical protein
LASLVKFWLLARLNAKTIHREDAKSAKEFKTGE